MIEDTMVGYIHVWYLRLRDLLAY